MPTRILVIKKLALKDAVLLVGLPGIGLVGKIAVDYLLKQFKTEKVAEILSDSFPPSVHTKESKVFLIKDDVFHFNFKGKDFLFLAGPVQPTLDFKVGSSHEHYEFAETLVNFFKSIGVSEIITLAGINVGDNRINKKPEVIVAGTDDVIIDLWKKFGAKEDKKEGLISGAAGLFVGIGRLHNIKGACLMGETNPQLVYGDHGSAKQVVELISKRFNFMVKMKSIEKDSKQIEKAFKELTTGLEHPVEDETKADNLSYVR
ncbi:MAG: PAC2 family protein [Candidatus Diapherotrites archaeon]|nr:PAC2 family protein [Candidatus Diapherotrites archaeon]